MYISCISVAFACICASRNIFDGMNEELHISFLNELCNNMDTHTQSLQTSTVSTFFSILNYYIYYVSSLHMKYILIY